jgi:predicted Zn-dependent protease with MMP-like domain
VQSDQNGPVASPESGAPQRAVTPAGPDAVTATAGPADLRVRRRDRRGRGMRGRLAPPGVPLYRTRSEQFDDIVLDAVARLEPRWEAQVASVEFAVQEVPDADELADDVGEIPLARVVPGSPDRGDAARPATPARIVVYRRPALARAETDDELRDLVYDLVVEELARVLGVDPESIDPDYDGGFD